jgi:histidinol dehydrogenase
VFVGPWSAQVAGDYAIGSNHVLPTAGAARVRGGLSAADFVRQITVQRLTSKGLRRIAPSVIALARAEGLEGHARSIEMRLAVRGAGSAALHDARGKRTRREK